MEQRVAVVQNTCTKSVSWKGAITGVNEMRRHYSNYLKGMPNIKEFRNKLVILKTVEEIDEVLASIIANYSGYKFERTPIEMIDYHEKCPV